MGENESAVRQVLGLADDDPKSEAYWGVLGILEAVEAARKGIEGRTIKVNNAVKFEQAVRTAAEQLRAYLRKHPSYRTDPLLSRAEPYLGRMAEKSRAAIQRANGIRALNMGRRSYPRQ